MTGYPSRPLPPIRRARRSPITWGGALTTVLLLACVAVLTEAIVLGFGGAL